jgi:hypothetical protein
MFDVALFPDYAALIHAVDLLDQQAKLRHRISVFAEGTLFLLANLIAISGNAMTGRRPEP